MWRLGLLVVALAVVVGCGGDGVSPQGDASDSTTSPPAAVGVELEGETLDGIPLSLADFRGTPVFVNVWASW